MHKRFWKRIIYVGLYYYKYDTNMTCRKYIRKIKNKQKPRNIKQLCCRKNYPEDYV